MVVEEFHEESDSDDVDAATLDLDPVLVGKIDWAGVDAGSPCPPKDGKRNPRR